MANKVRPLGGNDGPAVSHILRIDLANPSACCGHGRQGRQLFTQDDSLERIHPTVSSALYHRVVFPIPTVLSQFPGSICESRVRAHDCSRVTNGSQVLCRIEAESCRIS